MSDECQSEHVPQQQAVLDAFVGRDARILIVNAGPGTGKTRTFARLMEFALLEARAPHQGIAALSFTNVAKNEIRSRLSVADEHPHFVGTLDAFFLRHVVRPFGRAAGIALRGPILIPDPLHRQLREPTVLISDGGDERAALFSCDAYAGTITAPSFIAEMPYGVRKPVAPSRSGELLGAKRREWATCGRVTHADSQWLAATLLSSSPVAAQVVRTLADRFPVVLVDEFQDTGYFLAEALVALIEQSDVRAVVVGDLDQSIYGFGGARPAEFVDRLKSRADSLELGLDTSLRCSKRVCRVATSLSTSGRTVQAAKEAPDGHALLVVYRCARGALDEATLSAVADVVGAEEAAVLGRRKREVAVLRGVQSRYADPGSTAGRALIDAVQDFLAGEHVRAYRKASVALSRVVFDDHDAERQLLARGIHPSSWRRAVGAALIAAAGDAADGAPVKEWVASARTNAEALAKVVLGEEVRLGRKFKSPASDCPALETDSVADPSRFLPNATFSTIHGVKGEEYEAVVLVVSPSGGASCPSVAWFSDDPASLEERRVAFVAVTRARRTLVVCLPRDSFEALSDSHPDFVALFDVLEIPA